MTEQQRPGEDVEGHMAVRKEDAADEVEGHGRPSLEDEASGDEVEGHVTRLISQEEGSADPDDVEGHGFKL